MMRVSAPHLAPLGRTVGLALLLAAGAACATAPKSAPSVPRDAPVRPRALRAQLDALFGIPDFQRASWGVLVQSLDTGEVLYRLNPSKLMVPASNMKIVTVAAAAERLGWEHRFETSLATNAPVEGGILRGDLVVVGSGDPTINGRDGRAPARVFDEWAEALRAAGITAIDGRVVGDDDAFDDVRWGPGWEWNDLALAYAAPLGALQFDENTATLTVVPGPSEGNPATIRPEPDAGDLTVVNQVTTGPAGSDPSLSLSRLPTRTTLTIAGSVPAGGEPLRVRAAVENPTLVFARALRATLQARGIDVRGEAVDIDELTPEAHRRTAPGSDTGRRTLATHRSPSLAEVAVPLMKESLNIYADALFEAMGARQGVGSMASGREAVVQTLTGWGVPETDYVIADGSGLSRLNYLSASTIAAVLERMYRHDAHRERFLATLPVAGEDGALRGRMRETRAAGNVRAKTGTMSHVRNLSGYVTTRDGERLVFSILANDFTQPSWAVDAIVDHAVERLANLTRR